MIRKAYIQEIKIQWLCFELSYIENNFILGYLRIVQTVKNLPAM